MKAGEGLLRALPRLPRRRAGTAAVAGLTLAASLSAVPAQAQDVGYDVGNLSDEVAAAVSAAREGGDRVRIDGATTESAEFFATPDGKVTARMSAGTVPFQRDGSWVPVDLNLRAQPDGSVTAVAHPGNLTLSGQRPAGSGDLAAIGRGTDRVVMGWDGALPAPVLEGTRATYHDVKPGVDLVVQATDSGFEQFTVLKSRSAVKHITEIVLPLRGAGVAAAEKDKAGRISLRGSNQRTRAEIPTPMMWDASSADRRTPPRRRQVTTAVTAESGSAPVSLRLTPDKAWLNSPATVYPVTIDPYVDWSGTAASTTVVQGYSTGWPDADSLFVGSYDASWKARSFITWYANRLQGMQVETATAYFANPFSSSCSPRTWEIWSTGPITDETSWANQPEWIAQESTSTATSCSGGWVTADATGFFQRAVEKEITEPTMGLRAADEADYSQYKQFWSHNYSGANQVPYVEITYSQPTAPADPEQAAWDRQTRLSNFKDWILIQPGLDSSGYIESVNYAETLSTTLLWHGPADNVQAAILAEAAQRGITASVEQRDTSRQEIDAAVTEMITASSGDSFDEFQINTVLGVTADFDGIIVKGQHTTETPSGQEVPVQFTTPAAEQAADTELSERATDELGVEVKVETAEAPVEAATTRTTDSSPYNAGGLMQGSDGSRCTSGFAVRIG